MVPGFTSKRSNSGQYWPCAPRFGSPGINSMVIRNRRGVAGRPESPYVPAIVAIGCAVAVMYLGIRPVSDNDAWWHLKVGEYLTHGGAFVGPDPWSPFATRPFVVNQWLPEVVAFKGYEWFGLPAVAWLRCVAILLLFTAILWCTRHVADTVPALIIALTALSATAGGLGERPQLVSFIMLALWVGASWRTAEDLRPRWWLIPLTWVWANSHGLWLTGIGIGAIVVAGLLLDRRLTVRAAARLLLVPAASFAVCALTPVGPRLLLTPFEVSQIATEFVQEWQPTAVRTSLTAILTLVLIAAAILGWIRTPAKTPWWKLGLAIAAVVSTLAMVRTIPVGAIIAAPLAASALQSLRHSPPRPPGRRAMRLWALLVLTCAVIAAPVTAVVAQKPGGVPDRLQKTLDAAPAMSVVLNDPSMSGWLLWREPQLVPVFDLRSEIFSREYVQAYLRTVEVGRGWQDFLASTKPTYALLRSESPIRLALQEELHWVPLKTAQGFTVLRSP
jgi:hypothetical protein